MRKLLKGQIWYFDLVIALTIFTLIMILAFKYLSENFMFEESDILDELKGFSDTLISEGIPDNWNQTDIKLFGISTNNSLDIIKLGLLANMTKEDYFRIKNMASIKGEFFVVLDERISGIENFGYPGYNYSYITDMKSDEFAEVIRYLPYRHDGIAQIVSVKVVMWDDKER